MSELTIHEYFREFGYGDRDVQAESYVLEATGSEQQITVVLTHSNMRSFPPNPSQSSEVQYEISGLELARLIEKHGRKI